VDAKQFLVNTYQDKEKNVWQVYECSVLRVCRVTSIAAWADGYGYQHTVDRSLREVTLKGLSMEQGLQQIGQQVMSVLGEHAQVRGGHVAHARLRVDSLSST
jgi:hypothetical protein